MTWEDRWLSVDEIGAYLGVKRDTVYKWIDRRNMPAHKVGRLWKFRKDEIDEWIRSGAANDMAANSSESRERTGEKTELSPTCPTDREKQNG